MPSGIDPEFTGQSAARAGLFFMANIAKFPNMKYRPRSGPTVTFSVSVDKETKRALKARADRLYDGNMSALITALGEHAERAEAVERLIARAGGLTLTDADRREIDREIEEGWRHARRHARKIKRSRKSRAA